MVEFPGASCGASGAASSEAYSVEAAFAEYVALVKADRDQVLASGQQALPADAEGSPPQASGADAAPRATEDYGVWRNRFFGAVGVYAGAREIQFGLIMSAGGFASSHIAVGTPIMLMGAFAVLRGCETMATSFRQMISGQDLDTPTSERAQAEGKSRRTANLEYVADGIYGAGAAEVKRMFFFLSKEAPLMMRTGTVLDLWVSEAEEIFPIIAGAGKPALHAAIGYLMLSVEAALSSKREDAPLGAAPNSPGADDSGPAPTGNPPNDQTSFGRDLYFDPMGNPRGVIEYTSPSGPDAAP